MTTTHGHNLEIRDGATRTCYLSFKRMESYDGGDEKYRGRSGPLR